MSLAAMSAPSPPHTLSIPPAPRIGTAGSPLDPPSITSRQPREGLGLGGIEMPEGMKGTAEDDKGECDLSFSLCRNLTSDGATTKIPTSRRR